MVYEAFNLKILPKGVSLDAFFPLAFFFFIATKMPIQRQMEQEKITLPTRTMIVSEDNPNQ